MDNYYSLLKQPRTKYDLFDHMMEGIQIIDHNMQYMYVNDIVARHGRTTRDELIGFTMMEKYPGIEETELFSAIRNCMNNRLGYKMHNRFVFPDSSVGWFDIRIEPVEEGVIIMSFEIIGPKDIGFEQHEISEEVELRVERRTKELLVSLEREKELNRMKSRFVDIASHEFRTPLTLILLCVSLLEKYTKPEEEDKRVLQLGRIRSSVKNMTSILNDILAFDRIEHGTIHIQQDHFNLMDLIIEITSEFEGLAKEGQHIHYNFEGQQNVLQDKQLVTNTIINLVSNAIKYSEQDVTVSVSVHDKEILLTVSDNGIGIPEEEQAKLFERFFRATNVTDISGTGLGLHIVKLYVEIMGGSIRCDSRKNIGTSFKVCLPSIPT